MIDDFRPERRKQKVIAPLPKLESTPLPDMSEAAPEESQPTQYDVSSSEPEKVAVTATSEKPKKKFKLHLHWPPTKREYVVYVVILILLLAGGAAVWANVGKTQKPVKQVAIVHPPVKKVVVPTTVASTLTGLPVAPAVNQRPVTSVMIENSTDARPQSGLDQAGVVFEAIAEGGITRFLALFQDTQPDYIGPVRSSRPYYLQWALGFDAGYAHVGGSPEALQDIKTWNVRDLDQFYNSGAYQRITTRYAPHNVYTSITQLNALEVTKGYGTSTFTGFARKADSPSKTPNATSIDMSFSGYYYNTHYDYDAATNTYKRSEGGAAHTELNKDGSSVQIAPKVVIALVMPYSLESDGYHSDYQTIGSGQMYVFQDGVVTTGTWSKASNNAQFSFVGADNKPLKLDAGQTWISALGAANQVTYK